MTLGVIVSVVGVAAAAISAVCWPWSALIKPALPMGYIGGPPPDVVSRIERQSLLNAIAAGAAGVTALCQGILIGYPLL